MMNLTINVTYLDGTSATVKSRPATEIAFERRFNLGLAEAFKSVPAFNDDGTPKRNDAGEPEYEVDMTRIRMEWLYFLAFHAAKQSTDFDAWVETISDIEVGGADSPDPSVPALSTET